MANITTQTIRVDLNTGRVMPTAFTHQNDTARTLVFDMYLNGAAYTMTGHTVKFAYISPKVNGQYSVIAGASMASGTVSGNKVSVTLPVAYTQISGVGMLTMVITPTSGTVRPVNIRLVVQKSADGSDVMAAASDFPDAWMDEKIYSWLDDHIDGIFTEEQFADSVDNWLDDHPEATTTVQDDSLTTAKFNPALRQKIDSKARYIFPRNFGSAIKDGDCNLIIVDGVSILIDCHRDVAWTQVKQFLDDNGVSHLEYFILSHYHGDHYQNIPNLISNGYIDADTVCYLPPVGDYLDRTTGSPTQAATVNGWFTSANIETIVPSEWDYFNPSPTMKVTFYNCDPEVWNQSTWSTDYNECSMLCLVEHGTNTALYTGDAYAMALDRAWDNGFINRAVDLYKINHHGINSRDDAYKIMTRLHPTYAVQPSSMGDDQKNNHDKNVEMQLVHLMGGRIYQSHSNEDDIIFESDVHSMSPVSGHATAYGGAHTITQNFYVDINTTDDVQDGTQAHPFKELSQALSYCVPNSPVAYHIRLADGTYNESHETAAKNKFMFTNERIYIHGTSQDPTKVIIKNSFEIYDSVFYPEYVTFDCTTATCYLYNTNARFEHVNFDGFSGGTNAQLQAMNGSRVLLGGGCSYNNFGAGKGISVSTGSELLYSGLVFNSGDIGINVANGGSAVETYPNTCTFTDVTTPIFYSDYANAIGTMQYKWVEGAATQTYTGRKKRAGLIILTNGSDANVYFYNCTASGSIYIKTLITQIPDTVTVTTSGLTATFTHPTTITLFAKEF